MIMIDYATVYVVSHMIGKAYSVHQTYQTWIPVLSNPGIVLSNVKVGTPGIYFSTTYLKMSKNVAPQKDQQGNEQAD